jgi:hypothetical protein
LLRAFREFQPGQGRVMTLLEFKQAVKKFGIPVLDSQVCVSIHQH